MVSLPRVKNVSLNVTGVPHAPDGNSSLQVLTGVTSDPVGGCTLSQFPKERKQPAFGVAPEVPGYLSLCARNHGRFDPGHSMLQHCHTLDCLDGLTRLDLGLYHVLHSASLDPFRLRVTAPLGHRWWARVHVSPGFPVRV